MGLSASQSRLLSLTARMSDLEYAAQRISNNKVALATQNQGVYSDYLKALDKEKITVHNPDTSAYMDATAYNLTNYAAISESDPTQRFLKDSSGAVIISKDMGARYIASQGNVETFLNSFGYTSDMPAVSGEIINSYKQGTVNGINEALTVISQYEDLLNVQTSAKNDRASSTNLSSKTLESNQMVKNAKADDAWDTGNLTNVNSYNALDQFINRGVTANETYMKVIEDAAKLARASVSNITKSGGTQAQIEEAEKNAQAAEALFEKMQEEKSSHTLAKYSFDSAQEYLDLSESRFKTEISTFTDAGAGYVMDVIKTAQEATALSAKNANVAYTLSNKSVADAKTPVEEELKKALKQAANSLKGVDQYYTTDDLTGAISKLSNYGQGVNGLANLKNYLNTLSSDLQNNSDKYTNSSNYEHYKYDAAAVKYYTNVFNEIAENGATMQTDENLKNPEWLYSQLTSGNAYLSEWSERGGNDGMGDFVNISWETGDSTIKTISDDRELAKAEAEYQAAIAEIEEKDNRFDLQLKNIETERSALKTESESIQTVITKNIERTFKIFDA